MSRSPYRTVSWLRTWSQFRYLCSFMFSNPASPAASFGALYTALKSQANFFQILAVYIFKRVAQHADDAPLYFCFGEHRLYGFLTPRQTVHAEEQHILQAAVVQVVEHPKPEFTGFICPASNAEDLLVPICCDTQDQQAARVKILPSSRTL